MNNLQLEIFNLKKYIPIIHKNFTFQKTNDGVIISNDIISFFFDAERISTRKKLPIARRIEKISLSDIFEYKDNSSKQKITISISNLPRKHLHILHIFNMAAINFFYEKDFSELYSYCAALFIGQKEYIPFYYEHIFLHKSFIETYQDHLEEKDLYGLLSILPYTNFYKVFHHRTLFLDFLDSSFKVEENNDLKCPYIFDHISNNDIDFLKKIHPHILHLFLARNGKFIFSNNFVLDMHLYIYDGSSMWNLGNLTGSLDNSFFDIYDNIEDQKYFLEKIEACNIYHSALTLYDTKKTLQKIKIFKNDIDWIIDKTSNIFKKQVMTNIVYLIDAGIEKKDFNILKDKIDLINILFNIKDNIFVAKYMLGIPFKDLSQKYPFIASFVPDIISSTKDAQIWLCLIRNVEFKKILYSLFTITYMPKWIKKHIKMFMSNHQIFRSILHLDNVYIDNQLKNITQKDAQKLIKISLKLHRQKYAISKEHSLWFTKNYKDLYDVDIYSLLDYIFANKDTLENTMIRCWNKDMSFKNVMKESEKWHKHIIQYNAVKIEKVYFKKPKIISKEIIHNDTKYKFVYIDNTTDLYLEGQEMQHCVFTYKEKIIKNIVYIFKAFKIEKEKIIERATIEIDAENFDIQQLRGFNNNDVSEEFYSVSKKFVELLKK